MEPDATQWASRTSWHALCDVSARHSTVLGRYVAKGLLDLWAHVQQVPLACHRPARGCYIVGNAMFYRIEVSRPRVLAEMLSQVGIHIMTTIPFRRRTDNRALCETLVTA